MPTRLPSVLLTIACLALAAGPALAANIKVEVRGVEPELRDNVVAFLGLSRFSGFEELDQDMIDRLAIRAEGETRSALRPFGYYEPEVRVQVEPMAGGWQATIDIVPGEPVLLAVADVAVEGAGANEPFLADVLRRSPLRVGEKLNHAAYENLKGELQRTASSFGYLDAGWSRAELAVDKEKREARIALTLDTGERYRFGPTSITQDVVDPELVQRYLRYREGDWYDAARLLRTQFALDDSQYFSVVEVLPEARDRTAKVAPISIRAQANDRHRYKVGVGYATDTGPRLTLGWLNRRVNHRGHRLTVDATLADIEQSLQASYTIPWEDPELERLQFRLRTGTEERGDIETTGSSMYAGLTQVRGRWQRVLFASLDYLADSVAGDSTAVSQDLESRELSVVPGISYGRLPPGFIRSDDVGQELYAELLGSGTYLGSDSEFLRLRVRNERRFDLGGPWHLIARGELGLSAVADFQELPAKYRFFAGGDRSVRGYAYDELSPEDAEGNKVGGRHLIVASLEVEHDLPRNLAVAVFVDAGNAFDSFGDPLEYSAGIGIRYRLPFLSVGLDVAKSLSEPGRDPRLHLNFTPLL
ncbi:MAG: BamA/TamA family outer membrane protein [Steroidobacteraceae bacterium]|jgi:translocation and assembly module TamA|nr:BamA/TamA family outer membrane protein [Steroidobacteraceae bacterium]